jgi:hypothetical protein
VNVVITPGCGAIGVTGYPPVAEARLAPKRQSPPVPYFARRDRVVVGQVVGRVSRGRAPPVRA